VWSDTAPARRITWGRPSREHLHRGESTVRAWSSGQARNPTVTTYTSSPCPTPPPVDANPNVRGALYLLRGRSRARIAGRVTRRRVLVGRGLPSPSMHMEIRGIAAPVSRRTRRGSRRSSRALRQTRSLSIPPAWQLPRRRPTARYLDPDAPAEQRSTMSAANDARHADLAQVPRRSVARFHA